MLTILDQIDYFLDQIILNNENTDLTQKNNSGFELRPSNFSFKGLDNQEDIYIIEKFLQSQGINFKIDFDFVNESPTDEAHGGNTVFGTINGRPKELKRIISELKEELKRHTEANDMWLEDLFFSEVDEKLYTDKKSIPFESTSLEFYLLRELVESQQKIYWSQVMSRFEETDFDSLLLGKDEEAVYKKKLGDSRNRINRKVKQKFKIQKALIGRKNNYYSLSKKVTKK